MKTIKICEKHGSLTRKDIRKEKTGRGKKMRLRCLQCAKEASKKYYESVKAKPRIVQRKIRDRLELKDSYIRELLIHYSPLSAKDIPDWMVEVKRASLAIKRSLKGKVAK